MWSTYKRAWVLRAACNGARVHITFLPSLMRWAPRWAVHIRSSTRQPLQLQEFSGRLQLVYFAAAVEDVAQPGWRASDPACHGGLDLIGDGSCCEAIQWRVQQPLASIRGPSMPLEPCSFRCAAPESKCLVITSEDAQWGAPPRRIPKETVIEEHQCGDLSYVCMCLNSKLRRGLTDVQTGVSVFRVFLPMLYLGFSSQITRGTEAITRLHSTPGLLWTVTTRDSTTRELSKGGKCDDRASAGWTWAIDRVDSL